MTLPSSPPISLQDIYAEMGAPNSTTMTSLYRGGSFVPNIAQNASVPTSGNIGILDFLGATAYIPMSGAGATGFGESVSHTVSNYTTTGTANATVSGGLPTKTYTWVFVSGTNFTVVNQGLASTHFQQAGAPVAGPYIGNYKCTITDGQGSIDTNTVAITINRT